MVTFSAMAVFTSSATLCAVASLMCMGSVFIGMTKGKFSDANALALKRLMKTGASTDQPSLPSTTETAPSSMRTELSTMGKPICWLISAASALKRSPLTETVASILVPPNHEKKRSAMKLPLRPTRYASSARACPST